MKDQKDIKDTIDTIVKNYSLDDSLEKLNGYFRQYYWNNHLRITLGKLYLKKSDFIQAGKMLYFKDDPNEIEKRAINRFVESCKNDHLRIFDSLVKKSKNPRGIDMKMSGKIFNLILNISIQEGALPTEIVRWICNYERIKNIEIQKGWIQDYTTKNELPSIE